MKARHGCWTRPLRPVSNTSSTCRSWASTSREFPYLRRKVEAETSFGQARSVVDRPRDPVPLAKDRLFGKMARLPILPLPANLQMEPVDTTDFADYLVPMRP